jgi:hypothetical protein
MVRIINSASEHLFGTRRGKREKLDDAVPNLAGWLGRFDWNDHLLQQVSYAADKEAIDFDGCDRVDQTSYADGLGVATKAEIDGLVDFGAKSLGRDYAGQWTDLRALAITVADATSGDLGVGDTISIIVDGTNDLMNAPGTSAASSASGTVTGDWGIRVPRIASVMADDPDGGDSVLSADDTLTIIFDIDTNQPAAAMKAEIDGLRRPRRVRSEVARRGLHRSMDGCQDARGYGCRRHERRPGQDLGRS